MTVALDHIVGEELAPPLRTWSGMSKYVITGGCHIKKSNQQSFKDNVGDGAVPYHCFVRFHLR